MRGFFDDQLALHGFVTQPAKMRALEWECSCHVGAELYACGFTLFHKLIDVKGLDLESVVVVYRRDDQLDAVTLLYGDDCGIVFILFGCNPDFLRVLIRMGARVYFLRKAGPCGVVQECRGYNNQMNRSDRTEPCRNALQDGFGFS